MEEHVESTDQIGGKGPGLNLIIARIHRSTSRRNTRITFPLERPLSFTLQPPQLAHFAPSADAGGPQIRWIDHPVGQVRAIL